MSESLYDESDEYAEKSRLKDDYSEKSSMELYTKSYEYLLSSPKDLWILYIIRFCLNGSTFALLSCLSIFLSEVHEISDTSMTIVFVSMAITAAFMIILMGHFPDRYGIKVSLIFSGLISSIQFVLLLIFEDLYIQVVTIIILGGCSLSFQIAAIEVAIKHYTDEKYRTLAISFSMVITNISLILGGVVIESMLALGTQTQHTFKILFYYCLALSVVATGLGVLIRNMEYRHGGEYENTRPEMIGAWEHTRKVIILKSFLRFLTISLMLLIIKTIFYQQSVAMPLYMTRDMGDDAFYGVIIIINQVVIIILLPICSYSIYFYSSYDIFVIAGTIAVISPLVFLLGAGYLTVVVHTIIASISESLLSPRIISYALEIAPKGKESVLVALTSLPFIFSLLLTGVTGGLLLDEFCPEDGERKCWLMWLIISLYTAPALSVLFFCRKWLEEPVFEHNPYILCSNEAKTG